jgi:hypothetical protein
MKLVVTGGIKWNDLAGDLQREGASVGLAARTRRLKGLPPT